MKRSYFTFVLALSVITLLTPRMASADGFDDARALAPRCLIGAQQLGEPMGSGFDFPLEERVSACTAAIQSGKLMPQALAIVLYLRGSAYCRQGNHDLAIGDLQKAVELEPSMTVARDYELADELDSLKRGPSNDKRLCPLGVLAWFSFSS